jgi:hypothetical protein
MACRMLDRQLGRAAMTDRAQGQARQQPFQGVPASRLLDCVGIDHAGRRIRCRLWFLGSGLVALEIRWAVDIFTSRFHWVADHFSNTHRFFTAFAVGARR